MSRLRSLLYAAAAVAVIAGCANSDLVGGRNYINQGNYEKAVVVLENAVKSLPNDPEARYLLGKSYAETGRYPEAKRELDRASELDPAFTKLRADTVRSDFFAKEFNAGTELLNAGQYEDALRRYENARLMNPAEPGLLQNLGFIYTKLGRRDDAIATYRALHAQNPDNVDALRTVLGILTDAGARDEAFAICREILQSKPDDLQILGLLADMYYQDADSARALGDMEGEKAKLAAILPLYEAVAVKDASNPGPPYQLGLVYYRMGDFRSAGTNFEKALEHLEPGMELYRDALFNAAVSYFKSKNYLSAESKFLTLIDLEPDECEHYRVLSAIYREQNRPTEALGSVQKYEECAKRG